MRIVFVAHPIGGDVENNLAKIRAIVREINLEEPEVVPFVPYYADCVSMDDAIPAERERGIKNDTELLKRGFVDEVRLYGDRISNGMNAEMMLAIECGIPVVAKTKETENMMLLLYMDGLA